MIYHHVNGNVHIAKLETVYSYTAYSSEFGTVTFKDDVEKITDEGQLMMFKLEGKG